MQPAGEFFFRDETGQFYRTSWITTNSIIDITTETGQPYVWGAQPEGYVKDHNAYYRGIITVQRQLLRPTTTGYEIIAEGSVQYVDFIQTTFNCSTPPLDPFAYHLNNSISDDDQILVSDGPCWGDLEDTVNVWADLTLIGNPVTGTGDNTMVWIDVWT